jgi:hypothetical protein
MKRATWIPLGPAALTLALALAALPAAAETTGEADGDTWFHAGAGLTVHQPVVSDTPSLVPKLELGLIVRRFVDVYLAVGLDVERESFEDGDRASSSAAGALSTELGARFLFGALRPGSAFFYLGLAVAPVFGIASYESDSGDAEADAEADYHEDRAREFLDRFDLGVLMGLEYLVSADFGVGVETGFVTSLNSLKKTNREEPDEHLQVGFFIPFSIRAAYHF